MSGENTEVVEETAEVSDSAVASIREALGDDDFDAEDLAAYRKDRKGWNTRHNRRNEELAAKEKDADDRLGRLEKLETAGVPAAPAAVPSAGSTPTEHQLQQQFYSRLGIDITDEAVEITPQQLFKVWLDNYNSLQTSRAEFVGLVESYGLLERDPETGNYKAPVNLRTGLAEVREMAVSTRDEQNDHVTNLFLASVQDKFPDSDWDNLLNLARTSTSKDVEAEIWEAAEDQQKNMDGRVAKRTKTERGRRVAGAKTASMAGRGAAVVGKRIKNPLGSRAGRKQLIERARRQTEEAV